MINEANGSSSACRCWRIYQVETNAPPDIQTIVVRFPRLVKGNPLIG